MQLRLAVVVARLPGGRQGGLSAAQLGMAVEHMVEQRALQRLHFLGHMGDALPATHLHLAAI